MISCRILTLRPAPIPGLVILPGQACQDIPLTIFLEVHQTPPCPSKINLHGVCGRSGDGLLPCKGTLRKLCWMEGYWIGIEVWFLLYCIRSCVVSPVASTGFRNGQYTHSLIVSRRLKIVSSQVPGVRNSMCERGPEFIELRDVHRHINPAELPCRLSSNDTVSRDIWTRSTFSSAYWAIQH